jgi:hypothetical protein
MSVIISVTRRARFALFADDLDEQDEEYLRFRL